MKSSAVTNINLREKRIKGNFLQRPLTRALFFMYLPSTCSIFIGLLQIQALVRDILQSKILRNTERLSYRHRA